MALDFRVTVLEQNGGNDGNSSVAELEVRVETLEGTAADHDTRISSTEADLNGRVTCVVFFSTGFENSKIAIKKEILNYKLTVTFPDLDESVADHETRLTAAEENIQGVLTDSSCNLWKKC